MRGEIAYIGAKNKPKNSKSGVLFAYVKKSSNFAAGKNERIMAHRKSSSGSRKRTSPKVWLLTFFVGLLVAGLSLWWEEQQQK